MRKLFLFISVILCFGSSRAQENHVFNKNKIESDIANLDKKRIAVYFKKQINEFGNADPKEAIKLIEYTFKYTELHNNGYIKKGFLYLKLGQNYRSQRKFFLAKSNLLRAEEIFSRKNDRSGLQEVYLSYANLYSLLNDNITSIKYALKSRNIAIEIKSNESVGVTNNTIANLYRAQGKLDSAIFYYREALLLLSERNDYTQNAFILDNIALIYYDQNLADSAEFYSQKALELSYKNKDQFLELQLLPNASGVYELKKDFKKQLEVCLRSKKLADSLGIEVYKVYSNLNYAVALNNVNEPQKAVSVFKDALPTLMGYDDDAGLKTLYQELSKSFELLKQYDSSFHYFKLYKERSDTLEKKQSVDKVNDILAKLEMDQKEEKIKSLHTLNLSLNERDNLKSTIIWGSAFLLLIILILLVITFKRFKDNKKLSKEISLKNLALVTKNSEITDSINYAKRIQQALLPSLNELTTYFPKSFVYFKPKDIVSGDFYWLHQHQNFIFIAVGDCTGHGVPGGFMSMLGHSFLNQIVNEKRIHEPAQILNQLRDKVIASLRQTGASGENKDGMDITLIRFDSHKKIMTYAAANNSFYLIRTNVITEYKADKQPIGYYSNVMRSFTQHEITIETNDAVYLFSDGYPDQFGGAKGKKLKHVTLQNTLLGNCSAEMSKQKDILEKTFVTWKGNFEQTDDVCVVGIKF